ncbi:hypothetical protein EW026_g3510 [Hermanssonia centrifuga]|uniref:Protein kinase domain-containing protein n=1 Tax=Hermanssonia centrifuga TaxID=98765 RepID=A0A4S4KKG6_9APHY|nr:hypothetical protein EW026_g3510 [Hermanssonia centrifuga]
MVYQMLDCLYDLRYKAKILHRDISANNVMWEKQGDEVVFKLIDFDYATAVDDEGRPASTTAGSKHRTGTLPFMAYALVKDMADRHKATYEPVIHMLCHDVESLYYLSGYSMTTMPNVEDSVKRAIYRETVSSWEDGTLHTIACVKGDFLKQHTIMNLSLPPQSLSLRPWLLRFRRVLKAAEDKLEAHQYSGSSEPFDLETVGGTLSRDAVVRVMKGEENIIFSTRSEKVVVPPEAFGSGAPNVKTAEGTTNKDQAKKHAPVRRAPATKAPTKDTKGKKAATAKIVTPKKMAAAKASQVTDTASKAELVFASEVVTIQGLMRRGPTTRSMTRKSLAAA